MAVLVLNPSPKRDDDRSRLFNTGVGDSPGPVTIIFGPLYPSLVVLLSILVSGSGRLVS